MITVSTYVVMLMASRVGNGLLLVANVFVLTHLSGSLRAGEIALFVGALPGLLLSRTFGNRLRLSKAAIFAALSDALKTAVIVLYIISVYFHSTLCAYGCCFLAACCTQAQFLSWRIWISRTFDIHQRKVLNALSSLCVQGGLALGAGAGGLLIKYSPTVALGAVGLTSAISAAIGWCLYSVETIPLVNSEGNSRVTTIRSMSYVSEMRQNLAICVLSTSCVLLMVSQLLPYVHQNLTSGSEAFGTIDAVLAVGIAFSAALIARFPGVIGETIDYRIGLLPMSCGLILLSFSHSLALACVGAFFIGIGTISYTLALTRLQSGRTSQPVEAVMATLNVAENLAAITLYAFSALVVASIPARWSLLVGGLLPAATMILILTRHVSRSHFRPR